MNNFLRNILENNKIEDKNSLAWIICDILYCVTYYAVWAELRIKKYISFFNFSMRSYLLKITELCNVHATQCLFDFLR